LEPDFFVVGFFTVVDFLAGAAFLAAASLAVRDPLERVGDFFASGAGEARGDGRGEDIVGMELAVVVFWTMVAGTRRVV